VIVDVTGHLQAAVRERVQAPERRLHDLWVRDGIAYSGQGGVGTWSCDVGNGKYGGTIEKPKLINVSHQQRHEIYPYFQKSRQAYLLHRRRGDEPPGRVWEGTNYRNTMFDAGGVAQTSAATPTSSTSPTR
jgi:hypothetical protein